MSLLKTEDIYAAYGKKEVLKGISMYADEGEIVSIIGPNGAGKSTFLKVVAGILNPYKGRVIFNNKDITSLPSYKRALLGLSYFMQGGKIFANLTVKENLKMALSSKRNNAKLEDAFLIFPDIMAWLNKRAGLLSGGQKQQLALAMIFLKKPSLILLDEPSAGLSPSLASEILNKIKEIKNLYKTGIIIVEQNIKDVLKISDRVYIISNGFIRFTNSADQLKEEILFKFFFQKNEFKNAN